ncbi:taurine dioxygenase [Erwinia sp. BNK-24-b]|uniref:taurine dioxygenase n=1 Tax=unclassified Erwinia TaxID=2622719 RepID=UPI0039BFAC74
MNERLKITALGPYIGAQVADVDLSRPLSDAQFEQLYHALIRHQVLFLRNQPVTPAQQRALAARFGDLHIHPVYPHAPGVEEIIVLDTHDNNPPDNDNWHTDVTFIETPPAGAILAAKQLPETGGDTLWASGIAAYEALSQPFKTLLSGLQAEHNFTKSFQEFKYRKNEDEHARWKQAVEKNPPLLHPVIRTHPVSGKQALFVNEGFTTRIVGLSEKEGDALLNFLFAHITKPEFQVRWRWQQDDIAIWDNRVTQHYANADYLPARRIMHRATILGDKPFYRPDAV